MRVCYGKSMERVRFDEMSDDRVLEGVEVLVRRVNETTAELLAYLAEVEARGLHLREACSSMFAFCVERLHMSESAAGKRIWAARTARRFPLVLEMIARGDIHLTGVNLLAPHLSEENHAEVLGRARHRTKRDIEKLVAEVSPRPDVESEVVPVAAGTVAPAVAGRVAPLAPGRYELRVTLDEETHGKLLQLQDLMAPGAHDPAVVVARAIDLLLERTLARKSGLSKKPRARKPSQRRTRHIPARVKRAVWRRDGARCAFVDGTGRRCSATRALELHHIDNWGRGAPHDPERIELRCRAHNQYQAVLDYGADFIAARRGDSLRRVRMGRGAGSAGRRAAAARRGGSAGETPVQRSRAARAADWSSEVRSEMEAEWLRSGAT